MSILKRWEILAVISVTVLGIFLRFDHFAEKVVFYGDHSRDFLTVFKIVNLHEWVYHGPNVSVTFNLLSPIYYYLLIPFYLISSWHPLTQVVLTTLVSILTIILIFFATRDLWNLKTAVIASLVYAVSAIVILENVGGLNPGLVPPATVLILWSTAKVLNGKNRYLWIVAASLGWMLSFHASCFFIIPALILLFVIKKPTVKTKNLLVASLVFFVLVVVPYGIQEKKHGGYNVTTVYNYFFSKPAHLDQTISVTRLHSLENYAQMMWQMPSDILNPYFKILTLPVNLIFWGLLLAIIYRLFRSRHKYNVATKTTCFLLLGYIATFGLALKFASATRPNWWFGNVLFPLFAIVIGLALAKIRYKVAIAILMLLATVSNYLELQNYQSNQNFGRYFQEKQMTETILRDANNQIFDSRYIYKGKEEDGAMGPFAYLFWYFDRPQFQEKYFRWLNWQKPPADFPLYLVFQETAPGEREAWQNKYTNRNATLVQRTNFYEIYKIN